MVFAEIDLARIEKIVGDFCQRRTPVHIRDKLRLEYSVKNQDVLIFEVRPRWNNPRETVESPIAKLRYVRTAKEWRLFWQRASLKWNLYEPFPSSPDLAVIIDVVERDEYGCFFG